MPVVSVIEVKEKQIRRLGSRQEVNVSYVIITYSLVSKDSSGLCFITDVVLMMNAANRKSSTILPSACC